MENQTQIQETTKILSSILAIPEKNLGKIIRFHSSHVPFQDREDIIQDMAEQLLDTKPASAKLAFVITKRLVARWWARYTSSRGYEHFELHNPIDSDGGITLEETLSSEYHYAKRLDSDIDAKRLLGKLPDNIQRLIRKRLLGLGLNQAERKCLERFIHSDPMILA